MYILFKEKKNPVSFNSGIHQTRRQTILADYSVYSAHTSLHNETTGGTNN